MLIASMGEVLAMGFQKPSGQLQAVTVVGGLGGAAGYGSHTFSSAQSNQTYILS